MIEVSERTRIRQRHLLGDHAAHRGADQMRRGDAERVEQADHVVGHVAKLVGRADGNAEESQLQQFGRGQAGAAAELGGVADIAVVEPDHPETAGRELLAELVVPKDHLGVQSHDHQHWWGIVGAENLIAKLDAVAARHPGRLMRAGFHR
jgi:hypothetical protein